MASLPDWNSVESTAWWSNALFWSAVVTLGLLLTSFVAAHIYANRSAYLISERVRLQSQSNETKGQTQQAEILTLRQQLTEANQRAARATQQAKDAEQWASEAEAKQTPRHLTDPQRQAIIAAIKPFSGQAVNVVIKAGDTEAEELASEFVAIFRAAGWTTGSGVSQATFTGPPVRGIQVTLNEEDARTNKLPRGSEALIRIMIGQGLIRTGFVNSQIPQGVRRQINWDY